MDNGYGLLGDGGKKVFLNDGDGCTVCESMEKH